MLDFSDVITVLDRTLIVIDRTHEACDSPLGGSANGRVSLSNNMLWKVMKYYTFLGTYVSIMYVDIVHIKALKIT